MLAELANLAGSYIDANSAKDSAKKQMEFQAMMSNTAHYREVRDLKRAGLNPILSAKYGGASTPAGAGYQTNFQGGALGAVNSAQAVQNTKNIKAQTAVNTTAAAKAGKELDYLKKYPWLVGAGMLKDVAPESAALALAEHHLTAEDPNSAKTAGANKRKYEHSGKKVPYHQTIDRSGGGHIPKKKAGRISNQEILDMSRQRRRDNYLKY